MYFFCDVSHEYHHWCLALIGLSLNFDLDELKFKNILLLPSFFIVVLSRLTLMNSHIWTIHELLMASLWIWEIVIDYTSITHILKVRKLVYNSIVFILVIWSCLFLYDFCQWNIVLYIYKDLLNLLVILVRLIRVVNNILIKGGKLHFLTVKNVTVLNICASFVAITINIIILAIQSRV